MNDKPLVSVIIPVCNCEKYISEAISSILKQTFSNFELIIIDDGSIDNTREILRSIIDRRVSVYFNEKNMGQSYTRNKGVDIAKGSYIAQLDADDVATFDRLEKQLLFFKNHPDCAVLGSFEGVIDKDSKLEHKIICRYIDPDYIASSFLFLYPYITHRSVMVKRDILKKFKYDEHYMTCQDYDLFSRISLSGYKLYNISEILVYRREHLNRITYDKWYLSFSKRKEIAERLLKMLEIDFDKTDLLKHMYFRKLHVKRDSYIIDIKYLKWAENWLLKLIDANNRLKIYPSRAFKTIVGKCWFSVCSNVENSIKKDAMKILFSSRLFRYTLFMLKADFTQLYINKFKCKMKLSKLYHSVFTQLNCGNFGH